ncbi:MAG: 50S ribosomal protein L17 [Verrucomicrobiota bacterium]
MRHQRKTVKLQRNKSQRRALLSGLACSLIEHGRIRTTQAKAKALRPIADRLVTLGKRGNAGDKDENVHTRRQAHAFLGNNAAVKKLFSEIAVASADRQGGYTRITRIPDRASDSAPMAYIEWIDVHIAMDDEDEVETTETEQAKAS